MSTGNVDGSYKRSEQETGKLLFQQEVNQHVARIIRRHKAWNALGKLILFALPGAVIFGLVSGMMAGQYWVNTGNNGPYANGYNGHYVTPAPAQYHFWGTVAVLAWAGLWLAVWVLKALVRAHQTDPRVQHRKAVRVAAREQLAARTNDPVQKVFIKHPVASRAALYGAAFWLGGRKKL